MFLNQVSETVNTSMFESSNSESRELRSNKESIRVVELNIALFYRGRCGFDHLSMGKKLSDDRSGSYRQRRCKH